MIIDMHTHFGTTILEGDAARLLKAMDETGIDRAMVFAGKINGCSNEDLIHQVSAHRDRLCAIAAVSPLLSNRPEIETVGGWLARDAIAGLKFYLGYEYYYPANKTLRPYLKLLEAADKPAVFHSGDLYSKVSQARIKYAHPIHIDDLAVDMPDLKIVIAHMGYPWVVDAAEVCSKNPNVYADLSGLANGKFTEQEKGNFRHCVKEFRRICPDPEKLLFGTDWPITDPRDCLDLALEASGSDAPDIMAGNAIRVFGLEAAG